MAKKTSEHAQKLVSEAARRPDTKAPGRGTWRVMDRGSAMVAGLLAQRVSATVWRVATGKKPPTSGRHPEVGTREAVAWAVIGGAVIELVKVGVRRGTATYWVKSTGKLPPGMKPLHGAAPDKDKEPAREGPAPTRHRTKKVKRRSRGR